MKHLIQAPIYTVCGRTQGPSDSAECSVSDVDSSSKRTRNRISLCQRSFQRDPMCQDSAQKD